MFRSCFGVDVSLEVHDFGGSNYVQCLIRQKEVFLTPEEEVRQSVLSYLLNRSSLDLGRFLLRVEHQSLDIAFYLKYPVKEFQPFHSPLLIMELKRDYTNITDFQHQLRNYMRRHVCKHGILTNGSQIVHIQMDVDFASKNISIVEMNGLISSLDIAFDEDLKCFSMARQGNFESLKLLASKYGKSSKFTLRSKEHAAPITCFYLNVSENIILYDIPEAKAKRKQYRLFKESFVGLIAISE